MKEQKENNPPVRDVKAALKCQWIETVGATLSESSFHCSEIWCHLTPFSKRISNIEHCQGCKKYQEYNE